MSQAGTVNALQGPVSSVSGTVPVFSGSSGKILANTGVSIDSSNNMTVPGDLTVSYSSSGGDVSSFITNTSSAANSNANLHIATTGNTSGDSAVQFSVLGVKDWVVGIDNSSSQSFKISNSSALGTSDALIINTSGTVSIPSGGILSVPSNGFNAGLTDGQILVGYTGNNAVATTIGSGSNIFITNGAGVINVATTPNVSFDNLTVLSNGFNAHLTNGQILVGSTGVNAIPTTISSGSNISVTSGAGSISVATSATPTFTSVETNSLILPLNIKIGSANITSNSVNVSVPSITSNSLVFFSLQNPTVGGVPHISNITAGVGFTVNTENFAIAYFISWLIIEGV